MSNLPADFKPITLQHIFNLAWQAFVVEKRPPARVKATGFCSYLTDDGRKCAIGLALPDGHPAQESGDNFCGLIEDYPELFEIPDGGDYVANDLQNALHDDICNRDGTWDYPDGMETIYRHVAADFGLTIPGEQS